MNQVAVCRQADLRYFGVVIGLAMICNLIAGALGGILIPMVLDRVRADPAVASGTFVTTITDVVGFFFKPGTSRMS